MRGAHHISSQHRRAIKVVLGLRFTSVVELLRFVLLNTKPLGSPYNCDACNKALKVTFIAPSIRPCQALGIFKGDLDGHDQCMYCKSAQMLKVSTFCSSSISLASIASFASSLLSHNLSRMLSKQIVIVAATVASVAAQTTTSTTSSAAAAPTEVAGCHAHGEDELFCFDADNEEWELTSSGFTADNLPESFEGCHMHDEEL